MPSSTTLQLEASERSAHVEPRPLATALALVAAIAANGVIGRDNALAWRLGTDMRRFKALTVGKPLIMGRRTWDSIGRPLPGRETVVVTRTARFTAPGAVVAHGWAEAMEIAGQSAARMGADSIAVVGGAEIYRLALPEAAVLHLTLVHARPEGDTLFPPYNPAAFRETFREHHPAGPRDEHAFDFVDLRRV